MGTHPRHRLRRHPCHRGPPLPGGVVRERHGVRRRLGTVRLVAQGHGDARLQLADRLRLLRPHRRGREQSGAAVAGPHLRRVHPQGHPTARPQAHPARLVPGVRRGRVRRPVVAQRAPSGQVQAAVRLPLPQHPLPPRDRGTLRASSGEHHRLVQPRSAHRRPRRPQPAPPGREHCQPHPRGARAARGPADGADREPRRPRRTGRARRRGTTRLPHGEDRRRGPGAVRGVLRQELRRQRPPGRHGAQHHRTLRDHHRPRQPRTRRPAAGRRLVHRHPAPQRHRPPRLPARRHRHRAGTTSLARHPLPQRGGQEHRRAAARSARRTPPPSPHRLRSWRTATTG